MMLGIDTVSLALLALLANAPVAAAQHIHAPIRHRMLTRHVSTSASASNGASRQTQAPTSSSADLPFNSVVESASYPYFPPSSSADGHASAAVPSAASSSSSALPTSSVAPVASSSSPLTSSVAPVASSSSPLTSSVAPVASSSSPLTSSVAPVASSSSPSTSSASASLPTATKPTRTCKSQPTAQVPSSSAPSSAIPSGISSGLPSASASAAPAPSVSPLPDFFVGANSYFLHAFREDDRLDVLDAMVEANMRVLRIFLSYTYADNKGTDSVEMPDLELEEVGVYDDTILEAVDQLMVECKERDIKLLIALHDRYALGYWSTDAYAREFGIVEPGSSGTQKITNATAFYESDQAILAFDQRIDHILEHRNNLMDNKTWSELEDVVYAFEPENEPLGYMQFVPDWTCNRAYRIKENLPNNTSIRITNGGGTNLTASLDDWAFECGAFDVLSVHDYGTCTDTTIPALLDGKEKAEKQGKELIFAEWGNAGPNKADIVDSFVDALAEAEIPHMIWQIVKPGQGTDDFEIWTDEPAWDAFVPPPTNTRMRIARRSAPSPRVHAFDLSWPPSPYLPPYSHNLASPYANAFQHYSTGPRYIKHQALSIFQARS